MPKGVEVQQEERLEIEKKLEEYFRLDCKVEEAILMISTEHYPNGLPMSTYQSWRERDEEFRSRMEKAQAFPFVYKRKQVMEEKGNALAWLKSRDRERYYEKHKNETDLTTGGKPFIIESNVPLIHGEIPHTVLPSPSPTSDPPTPQEIQRIGNPSESGQNNPLP